VLLCECVAAVSVDTVTVAGGLSLIRGNPVGGAVGAGDAVGSACCSCCNCWFKFFPSLLALNGLICADVPLSDYSLTQLF